MSFQFKDQKEIKHIFEKYPVRTSALIPLLEIAQKQCGGWLSEEVLEYVAHFVGVHPMQAMEVATFYSMFYLKPVGQYHIKICRTLSCWLNSAEEIVKTCEENLGMKMGETQGDFTLSHIECLGYCDCAPVVQVNKDNYKNVTPQKMKDMIQEMRLCNFNS